MTIDVARLTAADWLAIERAEYEECFYSFVKAAWPVLEPADPFIKGWHIEAICQHLEAVTRGDITRLAICIPPGHMKSMLVAVMWNAWVWTHSPHKRFISTSSSEGFCERDNEKLRKLIASDWYQRLWPMSFPSVNTVLRFENDKTGVRYAKSFSSLTGARGNFLILDDILSVDNANSEVEREKVNRRYFESATLRLQGERDGIVIIMQRIHSGDLVGELMDRQINRGHDLGYDFLVIPCEYDGPRPATSIGWVDPRKEIGELICPAYRSRKWVEHTKQEIGAYAFSSQMNQEPIQRENGFFNVDKFKFYKPGDQPPVNHYLTSDHALGLSSKADMNVLRIWGVSAKGDFYLIDSFRKVCTIGEAIGVNREDGKAVIAARGAFAMIKRYKPLIWLADADSIIKGQIEFIKSAMRETGVHCRFETISQGGKDKMVRAAAFQSMSDLGQIYLPDNVVGQDALAEYGAFGPASKRDDQVDADSILPRVRTHPAFMKPADIRGEVRDGYRSKRIETGRQVGFF